MTDCVRELSSVVGAEHVLTEGIEGYCTDWTGRWRGSAIAVVRPGSTEEVAAVVQVCADRGVAITPQGGNTGLVGGAVPDSSVVVSTTRLTSIAEVVDDAVTVGAGVTIGEVHRVARDHGLVYGVDLASRDSATVGGTIATDAGGTRVVAHGPTRAQVAGIEAVLADGTVVSRLQGLAKDSSGYDLRHLLVGSEGTLGIVTAATLRLRRPGPPTQLALVACASTAEAVAWVPRLTGLTALEYVEGRCLELVGGPSGAAVWLLVESTELPDLPDRALLATDPAEARRMWSWREGLTEAVSRQGVPHKLDVSVPLHRLPELREQLDSCLSAYSVFVWGHLAEANLHVNAIADLDPTEQVLRLVAALGGSISSEHGVGRAKAPWLHLSRSPAELAAMHAVKRALDPLRILNPGCLLP